MMVTVLFNRMVCNLMPTPLAVLSLNKVFRQLEVFLLKKTKVIFIRISTHSPIHSSNA